MSTPRSQPQPEAAPRAAAPPPEAGSFRQDDPGGRERRWRRIEARLQAAEYWLRDQGSVVPKEVDGRRCWVVRFVSRKQGRRIHRSIYLTANDPELLRRARVLIARYRQEGDELRQIDRWIELGRRAGRLARGL